MRRLPNREQARHMQEANKQLASRIAEVCAEYKRPQSRRRSRSLNRGVRLQECIRINARNKEIARKLEKVKSELRFHTPPVRKQVSRNPSLPVITPSVKLMLQQLLVNAVKLARPSKRPGRRNSSMR